MQSVDDPRHLPLPAPGRRPSRRAAAIALARQHVRRWMTGSIAVVMASVASHAAAAVERRGVVRASPFSVTETVRRIEQAAVDHGLPVLACIDRSQRDGKPHWVIVLASSEGGTPVQVEGVDAPPEVPMAVHVEAGPDGAAWVRLPASDVVLEATESDWPDSVVDELAGLPMLVESALH